MSTSIFQSTPRVDIVQAAGPLTIRGHDQAEIVVQSTVEAEFSVNEDGVGQVRLHGAATLRIPHDTELHVSRVSGPLTIDDVQGGLTVGEVRGPMKVTDLNGSLTCPGSLYGPVRISLASAVSLHRCLGPLSVSEIAELSVDEVSGPLRVRECSGSVAVRRAVGNASISDVCGSVHLDWVSGNLRLSGHLGGEREWKAEVQGNASIALDEESSAEVILISRDGNADAALLDPAADEQSGGRVSGVLGSGEANLEISANGNVSLGPDLGLDLDFGLPVLAEEIGEGMERMMGALDTGLRNVGAEISQSLQLDDEIRDLGGRIRERVQRDIDRFVRRHGRRAKRVARQSIRTPGQTTTARESADKGSAGSEDHVQMILGMVAEGKISPSEAEELILALRKD